MKYFILFIKVIVAIILLQTLYFKFLGSPESVYIFEKLGVEPVGRIGSGVVELIASVLLFVDRTKFYAAIIITGTMLSAIISHMFILGIEIINDGGTLFILAFITFVLSLFLAFNFSSDLKKLLN
jgi:putative oxidoreductase